MNRAEPRFVVCVKNKQYGASLELRKLYQVIPDNSAAKHKQLRVIDESGEDYLYPGTISSLSTCHSQQKRQCCAPPTSRRPSDEQEFGEQHSSGRVLR